MIKAKRDHLEQFIIEQLIGPGVSGYRFVNLQNEKIFSKNLLAERSIEYSEEVINIVPGGVYSTGILFPVDKSKNSDDRGLTNPYDNESLPEEDEFIRSKDNDEDSIEEDESVQIDQMYPNSMGLSCCVSSEIVDPADLHIRLRARYYVKVDNKDKEFNRDFGVLCEIDPNEVKAFITNTLLENKIYIVKKNTNYIILINHVTPEQLLEIKTFLRNFNISKTTEFHTKLSEFNVPLKSKNFSSLKQFCYYELKNSCINADKRINLYRISQEIEKYENIISHIDDLIQLNDSRTYGLWQCKPIDIIVPFPEKIPLEIKGKKIYSYRESKYNMLKDVFNYSLGKKGKASLSVNFQLSKDSRKNNNKLFLKAQVVNTSSPFKKEKEDSRYFSMFNEEVNIKTFFGLKLSVTSSKIVPYNDVEFSTVQSTYNEDEVTRFIYKQFHDFGVGHGCSVKWIVNSEGLTTVETEYIPYCDTPDVDPIPKNKENIIESNDGFEPSPFDEINTSLEFKWLSIFSDTTNEEIIKGLTEFVKLYGIWITHKRQKYSLEKDAIKQITLQELNKCEADKERMLNNINLFLYGRGNERTMESFRLMNAAMYMQLWHSVKVKEDAVQEYLSKDDFISFDKNFYSTSSDQLINSQSVAWRPFQLAFILLNLDGIFKDHNDSNWEKRNEWVDLVWFPTGGGKTEAYLGIIALVIINRRRLHSNEGGGTAAIMRYTLRLLTLQQFQRATLLIMALELLRRWELFDLGDEPICIGLWVGDDSLPNKIDDLIKEFEKLSQGRRSKVPFENCPWCRSKLSPSNHAVSDRNDLFNFNRLHLKCSHSKCNFSLTRPARARKDQGPIPVSLCDDEIYQHPPALLFGTVDKFAQLAHKVSSDPESRNKDSRRIFGRGNWERGKPKEGYLPPDLIIQDELHLLLGPLGSSVALFESAIDQLCRRKDGTRPKIISSTATTRNTDLQIMALFDRQVNLFPKPGVECDDSFFAFYKRKYQSANGHNIEYLSKRRYIGILPTGRTQIWMQMRLAAILMTHRAMFELSSLKLNGPLDFTSYKDFEKTMDYYHTIVSYFNSLKEVGKTESQIHTYILKEIRRVFNRVVRPSKLMHALYTYSIRKGELTGRLSGEDVMNELNKIQTQWIPSKRFAYEEERHNVKEIRTGTVPPDFIVATNMISVGIDISRFNSIIMNSMPRNIAEYIQASSRVARDSFGLVFTIHHPFRARDISHYEKFIEFHEKMYSYVEPISITPFTEKAVERYLGLYLATMLRHSQDYFTDRKTASNISQLSDQQIIELVNSLSGYFEKRRQHLAYCHVNDLVKNLLLEENVIAIRTWIKEAINDWKKFNDEVTGMNKELVFSNKKKVNPPSQDQEQLYVDIEEYEGNIHSEKWQVPMSLRVIEPEAVLKIKLK